jgi:hypothetical protein
MKPSCIRIQPNGSLHVFERDIVLSHLMGEQAEEVNRLGVMRIGLQDLSIDLLGGLEAAGFVVLEREGEGFGNRGHAE